jgi:hypothetical protein
MEIENKFNELAELIGDSTEVAQWLLDRAEFSSSSSAGLSLKAARGFLDGALRMVSQAGAEYRRDRAPTRAERRAAYAYRS